MILIPFAFALITDPERILHRAVKTNEETIQYFTSYFNSQPTFPEHNRIVVIMKKLREIDEELHIITGNK